MENKQIQKILINYIDDPVEPMRSSFDDEKLAELAQSIKTVGLIQPITVKKVGDRYEVISGHRRLAACRMLGLEFIDAVVVDVDNKQADAMKVHENLYREDVNPVDQAVFLAKYIESNNLTISEVAKMLNRSESWVKGRLNILNYPDYLIQYIKEGKLSLEAANYLNQIDNDAIRRDYARIAALQGLSANRALYWLKEYQLRRLPANPVEASDVPEAQLSDSSPLFVRCALCGEKGHIMQMENVFVHPECLEEYQKIMENAAPAVDDAAKETVGAN